MTWTKESILRDAAEKNVRYVRLMFTDITGTLKNVEVPIAQLEKALNMQMMNGENILEVGFGFYSLTPFTILLILHM